MWTRKCSLGWDEAQWWDEVLRYGQHMERQMGKRVMEANIFSEFLQIAPRNRIVSCLCNYVSRRRYVWYYRSKVPSSWQGLEVTFLQTWDIYSRHCRSFFIGIPSNHKIEITTPRCSLQWEMIDQTSINMGKSQDWESYQHQTHGESHNDETDHAFPGEHWNQQTQKRTHHYSKTKNPTTTKR